MRIINVLNLDVLEMSMNIIAERKVSLNITTFLNVTIYNIIVKDKVTSYSV